MTVMLVIVRIVCAAAFFAVMAGFKVVFTAIADLGFVLGAVPYLAVIGAIFWFGVAWENRERRADGRAPYSWHEAGKDARSLIVPAGGWAAVVALAYCVGRLL